MEEEIIAKSLLNKIERLEAFEERLSVRFENVSIVVELRRQIYYQVIFELHSNKPVIDQDIVLVCVAYDIEGKILKLNDNKFGVQKDKFLGFDVFEFLFYGEEILNKTAKLRLYPKLL